VKCVCRRSVIIASIQHSVASDTPSTTCALL
jgi:hypothetical protein